MCISNTPDTQVQEDHLLHNNHCHDEKGLGRAVLHLFDLSKSETAPTHDKPTSSSNSVVSQQQRKQQVVDQSSSSSPTIAEPSEVSSISSTTKPQRTIPAFILRKQAKMRVPTMIMVRMNDAAQQLGSGMSTNDAHLLDENDATTPTTSLEVTRTTTTIISDAISTFSSWVQPNSETSSSNDDTSRSCSSSNGVLSTFSSWVRPYSPNDTC